MIPSSETYDVAIAGAGPAGTSAAIHLAGQGMLVLFGVGGSKQKNFRRAKPLWRVYFSRMRLPLQATSVSEKMISARRRIV